MAGFRLNDGGVTPIVHPIPSTPSGGGGGGSASGGSGSGGGGGGGGSGASYSTNTVSSQPLNNTTTTTSSSSSAPASTFTPIHIDPNAYKGDPQYIQQLAALNASLQNYQTDYNNKAGQYNTQYSQALKNLGWSPAVAGTLDNPATPNIDESKGTWLLNDQNTAAGRGYQQQNNDFAARNMLQSSLYAQAVDNLMRSLNDQNSTLANNKQAYLSGLDSDLAQFKNNNQLQQTQIASDAMNRVLQQAALGTTGG